VCPCGHNQQWQRVITAALISPPTDGDWAGKPPRA
jgi:hypothetical protein